MVKERALLSSLLRLGRSCQLRLAFVTSVPIEEASLQYYLQLVEKAYGHRPGITINSLKEVRDLSHGNYL